MYLIYKILTNMSRSTIWASLGRFSYYKNTNVVNAPGCTAAEGLLYKPWSLVVPTYTARCLHQRP